MGLGAVQQMGDMGVLSEVTKPVTLDNYSTNESNIVQTQMEQGNWVTNPWVSNKQFDYKIQVDYAF